MPVFNWRISKDRVEFKNTLNMREVEYLIADEDLKVLQTVEPVEPKTWELLNDQFFAKRPEVELRVYGFYKQVCDLTFTAHMTNVHHFSADCLMDAIGVENIAAMEQLESLNIGIYLLEGFQFLNQVTPHLKKLFLGRTKSHKPNLLPLNRFDSLEEIYIEGHTSNIEVLSTLKNLQEVTLRSISTPDISYLRPLCQMRALDIKLGGIRNLYAIEGMDNIRYLELWQIKGLEDLGFISSLTGLQFMFLQSLRQVKILPSFNQLSKLRRIYMENMKGLVDIDCLEYAPSLEECILVNVLNTQPEDWIPLLRNPNLKRVSAWLGNVKRNDRFIKLLQEHQIEYCHGLGEFKFV